MDVVVEVFQGNYGDTGERHVTPFPLNTRVEGDVRNIELSHYSFFHVQLFKLSWFENIL